MFFRELESFFFLSGAGLFLSEVNVHEKIQELDHFFSGAGLFLFCFGGECACKIQDHVFFQELGSFFFVLESNAPCICSMGTVHVVQWAPCMLFNGTMHACIWAMDSFMQASLATGNIRRR